MEATIEHPEPVEATVTITMTESQAHDLKDFLGAFNEYSCQQVLDDKRLGAWSHDTGHGYLWKRYNNKHPQRDEDGRIVGPTNTCTRDAFQALYNLLDPRRAL